MPRIVKDAGYATFINVFECRPADQDEVVRILIDITEEVGKGSPGFISASTHRSTDGTRVFNYLQWRSADHLAAMQATDRFREHARRFAGLISFAEYRCEIAHIGEDEGGLKH